MIMIFIIIIQKYIMIKLGVLCPSEIAIRRFMPALEKSNKFTFVGVGVNSVEERFGDKKPDEITVQKMLNLEKNKAYKFVNQYGGSIFNSYEEVVTSNNIDAVYIPLPPALHFRWAKRALENGKHVLVEKPATIDVDDTKELIKIAQNKNLALHENYMFTFHKQLEEIDDIIKSGEIGEVRLYKISFGFPRRTKDDFRYNKLLGGGALIDAGGYTLKYASRLLGNNIKILCSSINYTNEFEVDLFGSGTIINSAGDVAQISYGMDNDYKCELEVWGSKGTIWSGRVLTAPVDFVPTVKLKKNNIEEIRKLSSDDSFFKSVNYFYECINSDTIRSESYNNIIRQSKLVDEFRKKAISEE